MYPLIRPLLFALPPEAAHALTLRVLAAAGALLPQPEIRPESIRVMGLRFPGRLGLAAGFDKNGVAVAGSLRLGFGFVEVGTVTPRPQPGQALPRVFRLPAARALINRMGFPNEGAAAVAARLATRPAGSLVGVNIGKNADTPIEQAAADYVAALQAVHAVSDYVAINISSPNTPALRALQGSAHLEPLLAAVLRERDRLDAAAGKRTPLVVKVSPDERDDALGEMAGLFVRMGVDGIIAVNTTVGRVAVAGLAQAQQAGGLSGVPLQARALQVVRNLRSAAGERLAIIGAGGVDTPAAALALRAAGADLVQLYTALVYRGPALAGQISRALADG